MLGPTDWLNIVVGELELYDAQRRLRLQSMQAIAFLYRFSRMPG